MSILFSALAKTDPIKENKKTLEVYDGPVLHILRYYKDIDKCYFYYTKEIYDQKEANNIYGQVIDNFKNKNNRKIDIEYFGNKDLQNANNFDVFYEDFQKKLEEIVNKYPDEKIYINLTSGTPQIKSTLVLLASTNNRFIPLQVNEPNYTYNRVSEPVPMYEEEAINSNKDESNNDNRVSEPKLLVQHSFNSKQKIKELISKYDYETALFIYNNTNVNSNELGLLLYHLAKRKKLEKSLKQNQNNIRDCNDINSQINLYYDYVMDTSKCQKNDILEYYNVIKTMYYSKKIDEFLVSIMIFMIALQKELINVFYKTSKYKFFSESEEETKFILSNIKKYDKEKNTTIIEKLNNAFNGKFKKDSNISYQALHIIIKHLESHFNHDGKEKILHILNDIDKLRAYRNGSAHVLSFTKLDQLTNNKKIGDSIEDKFKGIEFLIKLIYKEVEDEYFNLYDNANKYLYRLLK